MGTRTALVPIEWARVRPIADSVSCFVVAAGVAMSLPVIATATTTVNVLATAKSRGILGPTLPRTSRPSAEGERVPNMG